MASFEFVAWLARWLFQQRDFEFDWDEGNLSKSVQKHKIETTNAEQLFYNRDYLVPLGIQISPQTNEPRFGVLGMDLSGKLLSICFTIREGRIRVISARPMSRSERKNYGALRKE